MSNLKIFINPGHDSKLTSYGSQIDPGASGYGITEAVEALKYGELLDAKLKEAGFQTKMIQDDDLGYVCDTANDWDADIFISLHFNACDATANGTECLHYPGSSNSIRLSNYIQNRIIEKLNTSDRGLKERPGLYVLRNTDMPATLVEMAFIDQYDDNQLIKNNKEDFIDAIYNGILDYVEDVYGEQPTSKINNITIDDYCPIQEIKTNKKSETKYNGITVEDIASYVAIMLIETGVEGAFNAVTKSSKTDYPSIGCSQWLYDRADNLLKKIPGCSKFVGMKYSTIVNSGLMDELKRLLDTDEARVIQLQQLADDCLSYVENLRQIPYLDDTRCLIYAATWATTSVSTVNSFIKYQNGYINIRSLLDLTNAFANYYREFFGVDAKYQQGYFNRAWNMYYSVAAIDLTSKFGIPEYGKGPFGR